MTKDQKQFADALRPLVNRVGGTALAAAWLDVTPQTLNAWLRGAGSPNRVTKQGALRLLAEAPAPPETPIAAQMGRSDA